MNDKYTKVVYQSEPIGKEKIVLYLTTFDLEAFEKNEKLRVEMNGGYAGNVFMEEYEVQ